MTLVDAGFEYELKGRWYPAEDPRVQALLREGVGEMRPIRAFISGLFPRSNLEALILERVGRTFRWRRESGLFLTLPAFRKLFAGHTLY